VSALCVTRDSTEHQLEDAVALLHDRSEVVHRGSSSAHVDTVEDHMAQCNTQVHCMLIATAFVLLTIFLITLMAMVAILSSAANMYSEGAYSVV
jgi:hypothetical protein